MLLVLTNDIPFHILAQSFEQRGWTLAHVRSCTFPSRPEPKEAYWVDESSGQRTCDYIYEPDLEVRALILHFFLDEQDPHTWLCATLVPHEEHDVQDVSSTLPQLEHELHHGSHADAQRAAAALRLLIKYGSDTQRTKAQDHMVLALSPKTSVLARRAVAEQLTTCHIVEALGALEACAREDDDLDVRLHAHRALDALRTYMLRAPRMP